MSTASHNDVIGHLREMEMRRHAAIEKLGEIAAEFPDLMEEYVRAYGRPEPRTTREPATNGKPKLIGRRARSGTAYQRVVNLFVKNGNEWLDTSQITQQSGVMRNAVAHILWSAHKGDFEQRHHPTHKRMKLWRLTPQALDRMKSQERMFDRKQAEPGT